MTLILIIIEIIFLFMPLLYQVSSMPQWIVDVFSICLFISGVAIACYRAYADYNDKSGQLSSTKVQDRNEGSIKNDDKDVVNSSADMLSIEFQRKTKRKIDNMDDTRIQVVDKESSHESSFQGFTKIKLDQDNLSLTNRDLELKKFNGNYEKNKINVDTERNAHAESQPNSLRSKEGSVLKNNQNKALTNPKKNLFINALKDIGDLDNEIGGTYKETKLYQSPVSIGVTPKHFRNLNEITVRKIDKY